MDTMMGTLQEERDSASSTSTCRSVPFENVDPTYLEMLEAEEVEDYDSLSEEPDNDKEIKEIDSGEDSDSPTADSFPSVMETMNRSGGPPPVSRMTKKDHQHQSFRNRKKREMRHQSFIYKQVSDDATPTAHRKQIFSKRSACKLTEIAEEELTGGKHMKVNDYYFLKTLGKGAYGEVRLATKNLVEDDLSQHTSRYAIKVMQRSMFEEKKQLAYRGRRHTADDAVVQPENRSGSGPLEDDNIPSALLREINIMKRLVHPNLVGLKEIINDSDSKYLFLVLEYMQGGTVVVFDEKTNKYVYGLTKTVMLEGTARRVFKDLASALSYLHANHIAHRDIKPDNLLIDLDGTLKLSDFGVSTHFANDRYKRSISMKSLARSTSRGQMQQTEGTYSFYSPEMCSTGGVSERDKGYNAYMADLWAAGICLWIFVFGVVPFESNDVTELFRMIREDDVPRPHRLSPELDNLLGLMMRKEVTRRPSIIDVRHHCWITEKPLAQHGEVIVTDFEVKTPMIRKNDREHPQSSTKSPTLPANISGPSFLENTQKSSLSPALHAKVIAWAGRARNICSTRHQAFVAKGQAEVNSLVRKALLKVKDLKTEEGSDDSSDFSMGGGSSSDSGEDAGVTTEILMSPENKGEHWNVFGSFYGFNDDIPEQFAVTDEDSQSRSRERNIFQRGFHKIGKRILNLQKSTNEKRESLDGKDEPLTPKRRSLVQRGLHKVVKKISLKGSNTDKHLHEDVLNENDEVSALPDKESEDNTPKLLPRSHYLTV